MDAVLDTAFHLNNDWKKGQNKPCTSYLCSGAPGAQALNKPPLQRNRLFKGCSKTFRTNPSTTPRTSSRTSRPHKRPVQPPSSVQPPYKRRTSAVQAAVQRGRKAPYKRPAQRLRTTLRTKSPVQARTRPVQRFCFNEIQYTIRSSYPYYIVPS